jgi:hypothetical protein
MASLVTMVLSCAIQQGGATQYPSRIKDMIKRVWYPANPLLARIPAEGCFGACSCRRSLQSGTNIQLMGSIWHVTLIVHSGFQLTCISPRLLGLSKTW